MTAGVRGNQTLVRASLASVLILHAEAMTYNRYAMDGGSVRRHRQKPWGEVYVAISVFGYRMLFQKKARLCRWNEIIALFELPELHKFYISFSFLNFLIDSAQLVTHFGKNRLIR